MKVIDKTPFQNEKGEIGLVQRLQGIVEHGLDWHGELEAQKTIITQLDRVLEKGFTLIRNLNLENSQIIEPLILIGPPGVYVMYVTPVKGFFEAKGDQWNIINNDRRTPAPINLMRRVARLARALQVYLNRQGMFLPSMVEPVLMASSPAVHIESLRPVVRVVMSDAIKQFAASLLQARPVLKSEVIYDLVDHIINPRPKAGALQPSAEGAATEASSGAPDRARAIFQAADSAKPFDPADLTFDYDEEAEAGVPSALLEPSPSQPLRAARRGGAFSAGQWAVLGVMLLAECAVLAGFMYLIFLSSG